MTERLNRRTGLYETLDANGNVISTSQAPASPVAAQTGHSENPWGETPAAANTAQSTPNRPSWLPDGWRIPFGPGEAHPPTGSVIGGIVGSLPPPPQLELNDGLLAADQDLLDALRGIQASIGGTGDLPPARQLPDAPVSQVDPGLETLLEHMRTRQGQTDALIGDLRADLARRQGDIDNKWKTLGRWLSAWAASGDAAAGGIAMSQVLAENEDMRTALRNETLQLTQLGWSAEDAVIQAQANLLSGQHQARERTADRQYERDVAQIGIENQRDLSLAEIRSRTANSQANMAVQIAQLQREAEDRAQSSRNQALSALTSVPEYSNQAWAGLVPEQIRGTEAGTALATQLAQQNLEQGLMVYLTTNTGNTSAQNLQFLRQWDPRLTRRDLETLGPEALFLRLLQAPNASSAFQRNPQLSTSARFAPAN
jgi:hypothetical protein